MNRRYFLLGSVAALAATELVVLNVHARDAEATSSPNARPTNHVVEIKGFKFAPATLAVRPGDTITWINRDIAPHTATALDKSWDTGLLKRGEQKTLTVKPGFSPAYFCLFHPVMKASLTIKTGAK